MLTCMRSSSSCTTHSQVAIAVAVTVGAAVAVAVVVAVDEAGLRIAQWVAPCRRLCLPAPCGPVWRFRRGQPAKSLHVRQCRLCQAPSMCCAAATHACQGFGSASTVATTAHLCHINVPHTALHQCGVLSGAPKAPEHTSMHLASTTMQSYHAQSCSHACAAQAAAQHTHR
jgi:hypothetical protein